jgi:hypothetical protein
MIPPGSKDGPKLEAYFAQLQDEFKVELMDPLTKSWAEKEIEKRLNKFISAMDFSPTVDPVGPVLW